MGSPGELVAGIEVRLLYILTVYLLCSMSFYQLRTVHFQVSLLLYGWQIC